MYTYKNTISNYFYLPTNKSNHTVLLSIPLKGNFHFCLHLFIYSILLVCYNIVVCYIICAIYLYIICLKLMTHTITKKVLHNTDCVVLLIFKNYTHNFIENKIVFSLLNNVGVCFKLKNYTHM